MVGAARRAGNVFAVMDLVWASVETVRAGLGERTVLHDAIGFFDKHPEHLTGVYIALMAGGVTVLLMLNSAWLHRWRRRSRGSRLIRVALPMQFQLQQEDLDPFGGATRFVEREGIRRELASLEIWAPDSNLGGVEYQRYLATMIPIARDGDVRGARRVAAAFMENARDG